VAACANDAFERHCNPHGLYRNRSVGVPARGYNRVAGRGGL